MHYKQVKPFHLRKSRLRIQLNFSVTSLYSSVFLSDPQPYRRSAIIVKLRCLLCLLVGQLLFLLQVKFTRHYAAILSFSLQEKLKMQITEYALLF